jgi:hypothetical protein
MAQSVVSEHDTVGGLPTIFDTATCARKGLCHTSDSDRLALFINLPWSAQVCVL